jgi:hypothetical protein
VEAATTSERSRRALTTRSTSAGRRAETADSTFGVARAQVGKRDRLALASSGGVGNTSWVLAVGSLPSGLQLDTDTGVVSGNPRVDQFSALKLGVRVLGLSTIPWTDFL